MKQIIFAIIIILILITGCSAGRVEEIVKQKVIEKLSEINDTNLSGIREMLGALDDPEINETPAGGSERIIMPKPKGGCSLIGTWKQTGCAYSDGSYVKCLLPTQSY